MLIIRFVLATCLDAVFESLLAITEDLLDVLRFIWNVETVSHHLFQRLWMMEVEHFARAVVALANVVKKKFNHSPQELRRFHLPRYTCNQRMNELT